MASDSLIIGFDTSAAHCAAALLRGDDLLAAVAVDMSRGQAEELMPILNELLDNTGHSWADLSAIGVGIGPGNFTGIRISVSAARGLALALNIPAIGVSTFDASLLGKPNDSIAIVSAPREQIYIYDPQNIDGPRLEAGPYLGSKPAVTPPTGATLAENIARCAATRVDADNPRPAPLYIRAADAAPARDLPPKIL